MKLNRKEYIEKNLTRSEISYFKKIGVKFPKENVFDFDWADYKEHLHNRIHLTNKSHKKDFDKLFKLIKLDNNKKDFLYKIIYEGQHTTNNTKRFFDFSLLPLNIALGEKVYNYFIPPLDYFSDMEVNEKDPYGLLNSKSRVKNYHNSSVHIIKEDNLIGSHKFTHTFLFNIDFYCPIGCADCYKSRLGTREYTDKKEDNLFIAADNVAINKPNKSTVVRNTELLVNWMNNSERGKYIYDVILSGGEPLILSDKIIEQILNEFKKAKNLKILRICTGTVFLGLPFRITDKLIKIFDNFIKETNIKITFQVHLGNSNMLSPESIIAIKKIRKIGINLYSQIPIKNHINFFLNDYCKTIDELTKLLYLQNLLNIEPYMFIVDMHPSTNFFYVPLEAILQVWGDLIDSHNYPGLEKPRTLSLLFKEGNILLSSHSLFAMKKKVDYKNKIVTYKIPRIGHKDNWNFNIKEFFMYSEPLIKHINDNPNSLSNINKFSL